MSSVMPRAIHGVNTAAMSVAGCVREMAGKCVIPRDRQESPSGAQMATNPRIMYWRGDSLSCGMSVWMIANTIQIQFEGGATATALDERDANIGYAPAPTGAGGSDCWLRATLTILLRCARSFKNALAST